MIAEINPLPLDLIIRGLAQVRPKPTGWMPADVSPVKTPRQL
jgi:hypothetical protein